MRASTLRLSDSKHERLNQLAISKGISVKHMVDEIAFYRALDSERIGGAGVG